MTGEARFWLTALAIAYIAVAGAILNGELVAGTIDTSRVGWATAMGGGGIGCLVIATGRYNRWLWLVTPVVLSMASAARGLNTIAGGLPLGTKVIATGIWFAMAITLGLRWNDLVPSPGLRDQLVAGHG